MQDLSLIHILAGVKMDPKLANFQNLQSLHTHTRARASYNAHPDASDGTPPDAVFTDPASPLFSQARTILPYLELKVDLNNNFSVS